MTILVTGATGNVGAEVVRALAAAGEPVRALVCGAAPDLPAGATAVAGDLDRPDSLAAALTGADGVFLLPGYRDMPGLLAEATRRGVRRVVLLSSSSLPDGEESNAITRYMKASEDAVTAAALEWTILRPHSFMSNTLRWLPQLAAGDTVRLPFPTVGSSMTDPADIGAVAALALTTDGHAGRAYRLSGPESLLPADQVRIVAEATGRDLRFVGLTDEEARAGLEATMPAPYVEANIRFFVDGTLDESPVLPTVRELLGREPGTLAAWAAAHADAFR